LSPAIAWNGVPAGTHSFAIAFHDPPDTSSADAVQDALEASNDVLDTATMRGRSNPAGRCN
jgi:hypothetical protein